MTHMDLNKKYIFISNENVIDNDNLIVYDCDNNVIVLNEFECTLIRMFDGNKTVLEISTDLSQKYGESYNEAEFLNFVNELLDYGVINLYDTTI